VSAGRWTSDSGRPAAAENPGGRGRGCRGRQRSRRMMATEEEEDTTLVLGRVTNRDKRGAFCHGW
jgi:hypothetical protein